MSVFHCRLCADDELGALGEDGRLESTAPYPFTATDGSEHCLPRGYRWDGASIPPVAWESTYRPTDHVVRRASACHDWLCELAKRMREGLGEWRDARDGVRTSRIAAETFFDMLIADGAAPDRAVMMYRAVYVAGPRWGLPGASR